MKTIEEVVVGEYGELQMHDVEACGPRAKMQPIRSIYEAAEQYLP